VAFAERMRVPDSKPDRAQESKESAVNVRISKFDAICAVGVQAMAIRFSTWRSNIFW